MLTCMWLEFEDYLRKTLDSFKTEFCDIESI